MLELVQNAYDLQLVQKYSQQKFTDLFIYFFKWESKLKVSELQKRLEKVKDHDELAEFVSNFMGEFQPRRLLNGDRIIELN